MTIVSHPKVQVVQIASSLSSQAHCTILVHILWALPPSRARHSPVVTVERISVRIDLFFLGQLRAVMFSQDTLLSMPVWTYPVPHPFLVGLLMSLSKVKTIKCMLVGARRWWRTYTL